MKLITVMLFTTFLQVSASTSAQTVTLSENNAPLITVLNQISAQTGYDFIFTAKILKDAVPVSLDVKNIQLKSALEKIFNNQPLSYNIQNNTIIVTKLVRPILALKEDKYGNLNGTVTDSLGRPLAGASISISGPLQASSGELNATTTTSQNGFYSISKIPVGEYQLTISYVGYKSFTSKISINDERSNTTTVVNIKLYPQSNQLNEVVVNTGYQTLPKERATGSFDVVPNGLFNRTVSPNLIDHIDDVVAGMHFDKLGNNGYINGTYTSYPRGTPQFSIRGLSTINSETQPLIVVDNFPYNGDINSINPNDVESITLLKDAAAASIWGARAGNGVVVITTKKGKYNQKPTVDFNSSLTVGGKPNLFSQRQISTADYIGLEENLFSQGKYDAFYNVNPTFNFNGGKGVSQVVNILFGEKAGTISQAQGDAEIAALSKNDLRNDLLKYFFRQSIDQQYNVNVRGGSEASKYYLSAGYDNDQATDFSSQQRFTFSAGNTFKPIKNLEIGTPVYITSNQTVAGGIYGQGTSGLAPYTRLVDSKGNPVSVTYANGYSQEFINTVDAAGLYDLSYNPINELHDDQLQHTKTTQVRLSPNIKYTLPFGLTGEVQYQYSKSTVDGRTLQSDDTFNTRNLLDSYAQIGSDGSVTYPINQGGILSLTNTETTENFLRGTLSYNHNIGKDNRVDAIAGYETNQTTVTGSNFGWYGYNPSSGTEQTNVDYVNYYTNPLYKLAGFPFPLSSQIYPTAQGITQLFTAYRSEFANLAYTYKDKYVISGSSRIDQANLYGLNTNLRKKQLWSIGGSWLINQENFYHIEWLPSLKLRATYGLQGNPPESGVTSVATINYSSPSSGSSGLPYASLSGLPNPNLTWEKIAQLNFGLDFGIKNSILTGSIEYYKKSSSNLIANYDIDPTIGATSITGNIADLRAKGIDITLNSKNISTRNFKWNTKFLFAYNADKVTKYLTSPPPSELVVYSTESPTPIEGNAVYGVYSYKWGGLDNKGNPQGYDQTGKISENYNQIVNSTPLNKLVYSGRATPATFGSLLNSFGYKSLTLSANITYEGGYYFRVQSVNYNSLFGQNMLGPVTAGADFDKRWQKPGDENKTYIPSEPSSTNMDPYRDIFYQYSSALVQKGGNVRLKDISAEYTFNNITFIKRSPFSNLQLYSYFVPNVILWRANKLGIDPDYQAMKPVKTVTFGIRATLK